MIRIVHLVRHLLLMAALFFIGLYVFVALSRLAYPFELEWMEGGSLVQVARILNGQALYVRPSFDFIPYVYTPLYFYVSAVLAAVSGLSLLPLRLVSFAASLISFALIYAIVRRETSNRSAAGIAAGLYAATFALSAAWFDLARVDSLLVMWLLLAIYFMRRETRASYAMAGLVLALAWFTKQTALVVLIVLSCYTLLRNWRNGLIMIGIAVFMIGAGAIIWNIASADWFGYYVFYLPSTHQLTLSLRTAIGFLFVDNLLVLPVACWLGLWWALWPARSIPRRDVRIFFAVAAVAFVGLAFLGRANPGGFPNVLMPAFAIWAILLGLGLDLTTRIAVQLPHTQAVWLQVGVYGVALAQFLALPYPVSNQLPTDPSDRLAGEALLALIRETPGEVYVPYHGYLALRAGKQPYVHPVALDELYGTFGAQPVAEWAGVQAQLEGAVARHAFSLVIQDQQDWLQTDLDRYYTVERHPIFAEDNVFRPVTGRPTRPETVYVPDSEH